jgi:hypothetical protein
LAKRDLKEEGFGSSYSHQQYQEAIEREGQARGPEAIWTRADGKRFYVHEDARVIRMPDGRDVYY